MRKQDKMNNNFDFSMVGNNKTMKRFSVIFNSDSEIVPPHPHPLPHTPTSNDLELGSIIQCKKCKRQWEKKYHNAGASIGGIEYWEEIKHE